MRWLMDLFERLRHREPPPPPIVDREALRDEMKRTDPDFARVSAVQHDALNAIGAGRVADGLAMQRERQTWERWGRQ
jgi:hypothetical protein